jgi:hypothetical protein
VSLDYYLSKMTIYELYNTLENLNFVDRNERELLRYCICATYNSNPFLKKHIKLTDVMELPWDKKTLDVNAWKMTGSKSFNEDEVPTAEEVDKTAERMKQFIKAVEGKKE